MNKLCLIFNDASKYREAIYKHIDREYDCEWFFMKPNTDIKVMDISLLKRAQEVPTYFVPHTPIYYQSHIIRLLWKDNNLFFMLGDLFCLSTWIFLLVKKIFFPKKKVFLWSHGWYGKETGVRRLLKKKFFQMADGVFLYGNYAKSLMLKEGFNDKKLYVIHNSLDYEKQLDIRKELKTSNIYKEHFGNDNHCLLFLGRLTKIKRLDQAIEALYKLHLQGKHYNLILVGAGKEKTYLDALVRKYGLEKNVWFYGACYDEGKNAELVYNADLCVSPGNVGLTAMHVMMFGCPVLTHNDFSHQMPEFEAVHPGETGDFFDRDNVESLVTKIDEWFEKHALTREIVREKCMKEIDSQWTPEFQMNVIRQFLK